jgi:hypothetical protein
MPSLCKSLLVASLLAVSTGCASGQGQAACPAAATPNDGLDKLEQDQLAAKLIEVTMGKDLAEQIMTAMSASLSKLPGLPPGFMERFKANADVNDLQKLIIPIYTKLYDRETMIAAIRFYESETGKALVSKMPEATRLGMEAGQQWGKQIAEKTISEMKSGAPAPAKK